MDISDEDDAGPWQEGEKKARTTPLRVPGEEGQASKAATG